jgi:hypothetical protein
MPAERASMRCVREILRLKHERGASDRAIARSTGVARSTVGDYLVRAAAAPAGRAVAVALAPADGPRYAPRGQQAGERHDHRSQLHFLKDGNVIDQPLGQGVFSAVPDPYR